MAYDIVTGVPCPSRRSVRKTRYPFDKLAVGDHFVAPKAEQRSISSMARVYGKRSNKKFSVRSIEGSDSQVGCWRIS